MKKNNKFLKAMQTILVVAALTFTCDMNATSGSWYSSWGSWFTSSTHGTVSHSADGKTKKITRYKKVKIKKRNGSYFHAWFKKIFIVKKHGGGGSTPSVPLDGGLGVLVLGAAAFGVRKLRGNNNDKA